MVPPLREPFESLLRPLFDTLPLNRAMAALVVGHPRDDDAHAVVARLVNDPLLRDAPRLVAGLWLYVDDLDASHKVSQSLETPTGSFWHAIMHRREGDFSNSKYWYRQAGTHEVFPKIDQSGGSGAAGTDVGEYDPIAFVDHVAAAHRAGTTPSDLLDLQRREWVALFEHETEQ